MQERDTERKGTHLPISEETANRLLSAVLSMQADVAVLKAGQSDIHHRLFGNGSPGALKEINDDIEDLKSWRDQHTGQSAANRKWAGWIAAAVSAGLTAFIEWLTHRSMR